MVDRYALLSAMVGSRALLATRRIIKRQSGGFPIDGVYVTHGYRINVLFHVARRCRIQAGLHFNVVWGRWDRGT